MGFFSFIVLLGIAYLLWRVSDQMPDLIFRLSEIQRDIAEVRRRLSSEAPAATPTAPRSSDNGPTSPASAPESGTL